MLHERKTIALIGAGQLGSRYLQGLVGSKHDLDVIVYDPFADSLARAQSRLKEQMGFERLHVVFTDELSTLPKRLDLVIIATTADVRPNVVANVIRDRSIDYWIVEKIVAQSLSGLSMIESCLADAVGAWVNTPRRCMEWFQSLRPVVHSDAPITIEKFGHNWGLLCNSIHFLDFGAWYSGAELTKIDISGIRAWYLSKRAGFWDAYGVITGEYSDGSTIHLSDSDNPSSSSEFTIQTSTSLWSIDELKGIISGPHGDTIRGRLLLQSELTGVLVDEILENGSCKLPTLHESIALHRPFIEHITRSWSQWPHKEASSEVAPIT